MMEFQYDVMVCDVDEGKITKNVKKKCIYSVFCSPKYITAQKDIAYLR